MYFSTTVPHPSEIVFTTTTGTRKIFCGVCTRPRSDIPQENLGRFGCNWHINGLPLPPAQALALVRSPASLIVFLLVQLGQQTIQKPICSNCWPKTSVIHFHRPLCLYSSWDSLNLRWTYKLDVSATRYSWELKLQACCFSHYTATSSSYKLDVSATR